MSTKKSTNVRREKQIAPYITAFSNSKYGLLAALTLAQLYLKVRDAIAANDFYSAIVLLILVLCLIFDNWYGSLYMGHKKSPPEQLFAMGVLDFVVFAFLIFLAAEASVYFLLAAFGYATSGALWDFFYAKALHPRSHASAQLHIWRNTAVWLAVIYLAIFAMIRFLGTESMLSLRTAVLIVLAWAVWRFHLYWLERRF